MIFNTDQPLRIQNLAQELSPAARSILIQF